MATSMEVDTNRQGVMASTGTSGSVSISLHPLVIMNISEHWTRVRSQEGKAKQGMLYNGISDGSLLKLVAISCSVSVC